MVSQKCQYALRAVFELAKLYGQGPVKIADIAQAEAIPPRFLEVILGQLKRAGFVESRRGKEGGYLLARPPAVLTVGEIMRFVEGPLAPVGCVAGGLRNLCPLDGNCVFLGMWEKASQAVSAVYDGTTFQDLLDEEKRRKSSFAPSYSI